MNKGSTRVTVRVGDELLERIDAALAKRNDLGGGVEEWKRTDWIIAAIVEKLNHSQRSRRKDSKVEAIGRDDDGKRAFDWEGWQDD